MAKIFGYHVVQEGSVATLYDKRKEIAKAYMTGGKPKTMMPDSAAKKAALEEIQDEIRENYEQVGAGCPKGALPTDYLIIDILYLNQSLKCVENAAPYYDDDLYLNVLVKERKTANDRGMVLYVSCGNPLTAPQVKDIAGVVGRWSSFKGPKLNSNSIMLGSITMDSKSRRGAKS